MTRVVPFTLPLAFFLLAACAADVGENKPVAVVADVPTADVAATTEAAPAKGTSLPVDVAKSHLGAVGAKITAQHPIDFSTYSGTVTVDGDAVTGVSFTVQVASLHADPPRLEEHLKKADFLDVERYPTATFVSTEVKPGSDVAGMTHTVTGDLTIRGQTKRVTFPAAITASPTDVHAKTEFTIDRRDFGVVYPGKPDDLVQDHVLMKIDFVAPRA